MPVNLGFQIKKQFAQDQDAELKEGERVGKQKGHRYSRR